MKLSISVLTSVIVLFLWSGIEAGQPADRPARDGGGPAGFGSGLVWLLDAEALHQDLKLSEDQATRFRQIAERFRQQARDQAPGAAGASRDQIERSRQQAIQRAQEIEQQVAAVLDPDQLRRLKQIELQQQVRFSGPTALLQPTAAEALQLTREQRRELGDLASDLQTKRNALFQDLRERGRRMGDRRSEMDQLADEAFRKATALLTPDQQDKLKQVMGEPFERGRPAPAAAGPPAAALPAAALPAAAPPARGDRTRPLGVGFLIGQGTEELIPLLTGEKDFLELMLGPEKVRYIRER
jgi:hypothetical protein